MKKILEKDIQGKITKKIRKLGGFTHKISDMSIDYKPFDFFGAYNNKVFFIELKRCSVGRSLLFSSFQPNQIAALRSAYENAHDVSSLLVGVCIGLVEKNAYTRTVYIEIDEVLKIIESGKKSIPKEVIASLPDFFDIISD